MSELQMWYRLYWIILHICISVSEMFKGTIHKNVTFEIINPQPLNFMRIEYSFAFTFPFICPTESRCPIFTIDDNIEYNCFESLESEQGLRWTNKIRVKLAEGFKGSDTVQCSNIKNNTAIECFGKTEVLLHQSKQMFFVPGYICRQHHSLEGVRYSINVTGMSN